MSAHAIISIMLVFTMMRINTRHVSCYLNRFEFHFLWVHINKTNTFCFFMHNGRIPGIAK